MSLQDKTRAAANNYQSLNRKRYADMDFIAGAEWERQRDKWIRVEDELPPKNGYYFCFDDKQYFGAVIVGYFAKMWNPQVTERMTITHWQPLPEPPKEK